jgi:hypothetical protein
VELEMGYQYRQLNLKASAFRTKVFDPIIYVYEPVLEIDNYLNRDLIGTEGIQISTKYSGSRMKLYSYGMLNRNIAHDWIEEVQGEQDAMYFGFPGYKFHMHGAYNIFKQFSLNAGITKQGLVNYFENKVFENGYILQAGANARLLKNKNLHVNVAVKNITNADFWISSPTNSSILPMPLLSRQMQISLQYLFY